MYKLINCHIRLDVFFFPTKRAFRETSFSRLPNVYGLSCLAHTDQHVSGGQRRDEVVARLPDGPVHDERHQHQYVSGYGEHHAHADDQHDDDLLPGLERRQHRRELGRRNRRGPVGRAVVDDGGTIDDGSFHLQTERRTQPYSIQ